MWELMNSEAGYLYGTRIVLVCVFIWSILGCNISHSAEEDCGLLFPPVDSGSNRVHGMYLFIYPRIIPSNYFGCQSVWSESGEKLITLYIEDGHPKRQLVNYPPEGIKYVCIYENDSLVNSSEKFCNEFQQGEPFGGLVLESKDIESDPIAKQKLQNLQIKPVD